MSQQNPPKHHTPPPGVMRDNDGPPEKIDVSGMHRPIMREHADPKDGYEPVPLWLVTLFGLLLFWGGWYLATYSGGFRSDVLDERPQSLYTMASGESGKPLDPFVLGQRLFASSGCISCHQANGGGIAGLTPPLARSEWVLGEPARIKRIILQGLSGPIVVAGKSYNSEMPGFGARLRDDQIAAILTFIRTHAEWGNNAGPIPPESVAATRAATKGRTKPWSASELLATTQDDYQAAPASTQPATTQPVAAPSR